MKPFPFSRESTLSTQRLTGPRVSHASSSQSGAVQIDTAIIPPSQQLETRKLLTVEMRYCIDLAPVVFWAKWRSLRAHRPLAPRRYRFDVSAHSFFFRQMRRPGSAECPYRQGRRLDFADHRTLARLCPSNRDDRLFHVPRRARSLPLLGHGCCCVRPFASCRMPSRQLLFRSNYGHPFEAEKSVTQHGVHTPVSRLRQHAAKAFAPHGV